MFDIKEASNESLESQLAIVDESLPKDNPINVLKNNIIEGLKKRLVSPVKPQSVVSLEVSEKFSSKSSSQS